MFREIGICICTYMFMQPYARYFFFILNVAMVYVVMAEEVVTNKKNSRTLVVLQCWILNYAYMIY